MTTCLIISSHAHWRKARIFVPKATLRWWRLFIQEHYPKSKPGRPRKERPLVELVTG
ncbi:MAG: hypothetical protein Fur0032_20510 [Terrimicrobiaceae bacterium]